MLTADLFDMATKHEGEALLALLKANGKNQADLAGALGVQPSAVTKYVKAEQLGDRAWRSVREGLQRLGLPTSSIRPEPTIMARERTEAHGRDLRPLVSDWNREHLRALRELLDAAPEDRRSLRYWIDAKLER